MRQKDQTKKAPTGTFQRDNLLAHLEKQAKEHPDKEDLVPFTGEKRGWSFSVCSVKVIWLPDSFKAPAKCNQRKGLREHVGPVLRPDTARVCDAYQAGL